MNTKKAVTIGLLTIATLGLVACAIKFSKKKATESKADYYISSYTNETNYTFTGQSNYTYVDDYYYPKFNYTLKVTNLDKKLTINLTQIMLNGDYYNILTQTNNNFTLQINKQLKYLYITPAGITEWDEENYSKYVYRFYVQYKYLDDTFSASYARDINITTEDMTINPYYDNIIEHEETIDIQQNIETLKYTYETGYTNAQDFASPIDIRGLMLNILTMPFTFIRQAFNVTMWEGTPYQFNVSNFILSLIAIATILFIIRLFTSGFSAIGNYTNSRENRAERRSRIELNKARTEQIKKETNK